MKKEVSIVLSKESTNYRKLAQTWYGLTNEQMVGIDVHHNPPKSQGGRNIPEHLFVYHNTLHAQVHKQDFVIWCREAGKIGGKKAHSEKDENGKSSLSKRVNKQIHQEKDELGRSLQALKMNKYKHAQKDENGKSIVAIELGKKAHAEKDESGKSVHAKKMSEKLHLERDELGRSVSAVRSHSNKDEFGRSVNALKAGSVSNAQKWEDPDHPELGTTTCGALAMRQKAFGLPHGPNNRRKVVEGRAP